MAWKKNNGLPSVPRRRPHVRGAERRGRVGGGVGQGGPRSGRGPTALLMRSA